MAPSKTDLTINAALSQKASTFSPGPLSATVWPSGRSASIHPTESSNAGSKTDPALNSPMQSSPLPEENENSSNNNELQRASMDPAESSATRFKTDYRLYSPIPGSPLSEKYEIASIQQAYSDIEKFQVFCEEENKFRAACEEIRKFLILGEEADAPTPTDQNFPLKTQRPIKFQGSREETHNNIPSTDQNCFLKTQRERKIGAIYTYFSNKEKYNVQNLPKFCTQNFSDEERFKLSDSARAGINTLEEAVDNDSASVKDKIKKKKEKIESIKLEIYDLIQNENSPLSANTKKQLSELVNDAIHLGGLALAVSICLCFPLCFSHSPGAWIPAVQAITKAALKSSENEEDVESTISEEDQYENYKDRLKNLAEHYDKLKKELNEYDQKLISADAVKRQLAHISRQYIINDSEQTSPSNRRSSQSFGPNRRSSLIPQRKRNKGGDDTIMYSPASPMYSPASPTDLRRLFPDPIPQRGSPNPLLRKNSLPEGLLRSYTLGSPFSSSVPVAHAIEDMVPGTSNASLDTEQFEEHSALQKKTSGLKGLGLSNFQLGSPFSSPVPVARTIKDTFPETYNASLETERLQGHSASQNEGLLSISPFSTPVPVAGAIEDIVPETYNASLQTERLEGHSASQSEGLLSISPFSSPVLVADAIENIVPETYNASLQTEQFEEYSALQNIDVLQGNLVNIFEKDLSILKNKITKDLERCLENSPEFMDDLLEKQKIQFKIYQENYDGIKSKFLPLKSALEVDALNSILESNASDEAAKIIGKSISQINLLLNEYNIINESITHSIGLAYRFIDIFINAMKDSLKDYAKKIEKMIGTKESIIVNDASKSLKKELAFQYASLGDGLVTDIEKYASNNEQKLALSLEVNDPIVPLLLNKKFSETIKLIGEFDKNINVTIAFFEKFEEDFINPLTEEILGSIDAIDKQAIIHINKNIQLAQVAQVAQVHSEEEQHSENEHLEEEAIA